MDAITTLGEVDKRIALAESPQEANTIRKQISALQKLISKREESFDIAFEGGIAYCEASAKAGTEWEMLDNKRKVGDGMNSQKIANSQKSSISVSEAGFKNSQDATVCIRVGTELNPDERNKYYKECRKIDKIPTLGGLYSTWKTLYQVSDDSRPWLRVFNVWNFARPDPRFGQQHPGQIPGQIIQNLNYYYTAPGDLIVDLFGGGGVSIDVCKYDDPDFGQREYAAYDIRPKRDDIIQRDMVREGIPDVSRAKMVFLDPPYWKQKSGDYGSDNNNLANMPLDRFRHSLSTIVESCLNQVQAGSIVALIIGATQDKWQFIDHAADLIIDVGRPYQRIIVPYTTQTYGGHDVNNAKENKQWLNLSRDLMIWRKGK